MNSKIKASVPHSQKLEYFCLYQFMHLQAIAWAFEFWIQYIKNAIYERKNYAKVYS